MRFRPVNARLVGRLGRLRGGERMRRKTQSEVRGWGDCRRRGGPGPEGPLPRVRSQGWARERRGSVRCVGSCRGEAGFGVSFSGPPVAGDVIRRSGELGAHIARSQACFF